MGAASRAMLPTLPRALIDGRDGAVAVEFALIFPLMLTLFFGSFEVSNLLMANLKLTATAAAASDLVAQTRPQNSNLAPTDIDGYYAAAKLVMSPLATTGLQLAFASITYDTAGNPQVAWHHEDNGAPAITNGSLDVVTLAKLGSGSDSLIMVQATYNYTSPVSFVLSKTYAFNDTAYNRPRYVGAVTCTGC